jgi:hypothetical protein
MNSGIICDALTTILALELEYLEPSIFREFGTRSNGPQNFNTQSDYLKMSSHASWASVKKKCGVGNKGDRRQLSTREGQNPIDP